ncbi:MAG: DUF4394 domain-containing protein [Bacteroidia bacterium]|nr:DUF4394 domain-containing protein [Bacteroidia bacterium]
MKKTFTQKKRISFTVLLFVIFFSQTKAQVIYGTVSNSILVTFSASAPATISSSIIITGITAGQTIEGLDFRPNTGELYAFGYNSAITAYQVYTINLTTGVATAINTVTTLALGNGPIGFDFNPTVDRIRVVSANGANYRLHPVTGLIAATDGNLAYTAGDPNVSATPKIVTAAYINSYIGAATTALYNYDNALNVITLQNPPNNGSLTTVGASGITTSTTTPLLDMDIFYDNISSTNKAYLVANTSTATNTDNFYTVNLITGATTLVGTIGSANPVSNIAVFIDRTLPALVGQLAYGLSGVNLISFDTQNPSFIRNLNPITGITAGQTIVGMDFRPANHNLYALGYNATNNEAQVYTINTSSAIASAVSATPIVLALGTVNVGFDFNPTVDRIRVVSNNDMNYRLEPITGTISATDANINYAATDPNFGANPNVGTVAYINSYSSATTTTLYNYDEILNIITTQVPPNNGTLNTIGSSGIVINTADATVDMDIYYNSATSTNLAYLAANTNTETIDRLYSVNLTTGATTVIGKIGFGIPVRDIAIQTNSLTTGVAESKNIENNFIKVYPNPINDITFISFKNESQANIIVLDILGRKVDASFTDEITAGTTLLKWNTSNLQPGIYFVTATNANGKQQIVKVIK